MTQDGTQAGPNVLEKYRESTTDFRCVQETSEKITDARLRLNAWRHLNVLPENSVCSAYHHHNPSIMLIIYNVHKTNDSEYFRKYHEFLVQFLLQIILAHNTLIISIVKTVLLLR
jgi:hypothetical protein